MAKLSANGVEIARFEVNTGSGVILQHRCSLRRVESGRLGTRLVMLEQSRWHNQRRWSTWRIKECTSWVAGDAAESITQTRIDRAFAWFKRQGWTRTDV